MDQNEVESSLAALTRTVRLLVELEEQRDAADSFAIRKPGLLSQAEQEIDRLRELCPQAF